RRAMEEFVTFSAARAAQLSARLDPPHFGGEIEIVGVTSFTVVHLTVTRRAKGNDVRRMVRSAVTDTIQVVRLQVWRAIPSLEGSRWVATLANALCPSQDIDPNIPGALVRRGRDRLARLWRDVCRGVGARSKNSQIGISFDRLSNDGFVDGVQWTELENDRV